MDVVVESGLKGNQLECVISGSSDVMMKQRADYSDVKIRVSGSGDFIADNFNCRNLEATVSGSGDIKLKGKAETGNFSASGSGDIKVYVTESLSATASGSGDIRYKGNPTVDSKVSGSGSVKKAN
ncbi:MAG: DUF2807 domain-containing protein [Tannerellaceae bacterium]|nr:DUF2807 domain-containing protein [Tannerellaceae bacterium]